MEGKINNSFAVLRIDRGEEVIESVLNFIKENDIKSGTITGLGATNNVDIGLYKVEDKKYYTKNFIGDFEITNFTGNITRKNGEPYLHMHITFADEEFNSYGGHLNKCIISAACELYFQIYPIEVERYHDEEIGINILEF